MATSPPHRFGQIIGDLLEEIIAPQLEEFCSTRGLYLDKKGERGAARGGKKVSWVDKFGNTHDLRPRTTIAGLIDKGIFVD